MSRDRPGKTPEIPEKKVRFFSGFFFGTTQRYSLFLQNFREKISGKIRDFSGKNFRENPENSGKFRKFRKISEKKVRKMTIFRKFSPRLRSAF